MLAAMASGGADMSKPAHITHFLYFPTMNGANSAAEQLRLTGFQNVRVDRCAPASLWQRFFGPKSFSCIGETRVIPSEAVVFAATDRMTMLAKKYGGDYDGWEASIEP